MPRPTIKPIGIGDLKVVKQRLARYEAGELAHIENVLAREKRGREHRRLRQVEEIAVLEREREEESKRDLQSTERFELQSESQRTIRSETSFQAGMELSASYGPVSLSAFAKFATSNAKEEADKNSTKYAKEVTEKSMARLLERIREERRTRTLEEVEEKNEHGFDNTTGSEHITGVYRWVDKYYRARVVDYGKRLMYEFYVPEPAAFYLFASTFNYENRVLPIKPNAPTVPGTTTPLKPSDVTRTNYLRLVKEYNAQGVEPPPPEWLVLCKALNREFQGSGHSSLANEEFEIPKGYKAVNGVYRVSYTWEGSPQMNGTIMIGTGLINVGVYPGLSFGGETAMLPISGTFYGLKTFAINIEASCRLIDEYLDKWKLATFNAIMAAYNKALMDYEEKVAAAQIQQGTQIGGENPGINRQIERDELKRGCLTLWTTYAFNNPAAISHAPTAPVPGNYPEINQATALANVDRLRFFEEAFEWRNIAYEFYPYYWSRKPKWLELLSVEATDPAFQGFLRAGAARVVVPVRPSFTEAVLYYQLTGILWGGGPVPSIATIIDPDAELYNSFLEEMEGIEDLPDVDADVPIDTDDPETWLVKVPTTLVWLQGESDLPDFEAP